MIEYVVNVVIPEKVRVSVVVPSSTREKSVNGAGEAVYAKEVSPSTEACLTIEIVAGAMTAWFDSERSWLPAEQFGSLEHSKLSILM